mmetsp:Transcript_62961/g.136702  ORF Transcript_62961/g.136702 Transcript_62961/m.136702 type:complete len:92 (+) Transcript_62961:78-353(+)
MPHAGFAKQSGSGNVSEQQHTPHHRSYVFGTISVHGNSSGRDASSAACPPSAANRAPGCSVPVFESTRRTRARSRGIDDGSTPTREDRWKP